MIVVSSHHAAAIVLILLAANCRYTTLLFLFVSATRSFSRERYICAYVRNHQETVIRSNSKLHKPTNARYTRIIQCTAVTRALYIRFNPESLDIKLYVYVYTWSRKKRVCTRH